MRIRGCNVCGGAVLFVCHGFGAISSLGRRRRFRTRSKRLGFNFKVTGNTRFHCTAHDPIKHGSIRFRLAHVRTRRRAALFHAQKPTGIEYLTSHPSHTNHRAHTQTCPIQTIGGEGEEGGEAEDDEDKAEDDSVAGASLASTDGGAVGSVPWTGATSSVSPLVTLRFRFRVKCAGPTRPCRTRMREARDCDEAVEFEEIDTGEWLCDDEGSGDEDRDPALDCERERERERERDRNAGWDRRASRVLVSACRDNRAAERAACV